MENTEKGHITYKYRIYPSESQIEHIEQHFQAIEFVYNHFLKVANREYEETGKSINRFDIQSRLLPLKEQYPWLKNINAQSLQAAVLNLYVAHVNFFRKNSKIPKPKKNGTKKSFFIPQMDRVKIKKDTIKLPKIKGLVPIVVHRPMEGLPKNLTVTRTGHNIFHVCIVSEIEIPKDDLHKLGKYVGVDVGIKTYLTLSDGNTMDFPYDTKELKDKLIKEKKVLSKKIKGSKASFKQRNKVDRIKAKIKNRKLDFLHKASSRLLNEYDTIFIESLDIESMKKNKFVNASINDVSWGGFFNILEYKAKHRGKNLIKIDKFYPSSQLCSECGYRNVGLTLSVREWDCPECGTTHERDLNAAKNIEKKGLEIFKAMAEGVSVQHLEMETSMKDE